MRRQHRRREENPHRELELVAREQRRAAELDRRRHLHEERAMREQHERRRERHRRKRSGPLESGTSLAVRLITGSGALPPPSHNLGTCSWIYAFSSASRAYPSSASSCRAFPPSYSRKTLRPSEWPRIFHNYRRAVLKVNVSRIFKPLCFTVVDGAACYRLSTYMAQRRRPRDDRMRCPAGLVRYLHCRQVCSRIAVLLKICIGVPISNPLPSLFFE